MEEDTTIEKRDQLFQYIENNIHGCDFLLCLFFSALNSSRADQCVRPFPSSYIHNGVKDFVQLKDVCDHIRPLREILRLRLCPERVADLLSWLFVDAGLPALEQMKAAQLPFFDSLKKNSVPNYVFRVVNPKKADAWNKRREGKDTFTAYHGSRVENFYSILKVGLLQHVSNQRVLLYGEGIYLSSEISVSMNYSSFGQTWTNSVFGDKHSVIAVCEVIDDLEKVKCKDVKYKNRAVVTGAFGEVPEKYFVVTDSELVLVKYLLVYKASSLPFWRSYVFNKPVLFLVGYLVVLVFVGFYNSWFWKRIWYKFVTGYLK